MASSDRVNDALASIGSTSSDGENNDVVPRFTIESETNRQYSRFNAVERVNCTLLTPCYRG